jgi:dihydrofolate reductase
MLLSNLFFIVAADAQNGIGKNNALPWHISADLKHFKRLTFGNYVILGRKTWESLPVRPLPGRKHILLTRSAGNVPSDVLCFSNKEKIIDFIQQHEQALFYVIGGASLYEQFLEVTETIFLTRIYKIYPTDTFFPSFARSFRLEEFSPLFFDEKEKVYFRFCTYKRKGK